MFKIRKMKDILDDILFNNLKELMDIEYVLMYEYQDEVYKMNEYFV